MVNRVKAKIGIECEGRLRGVPTLFVNADDVAEAYASLIKDVPTFFTHIYVSDRNNTLNYSKLGSLFAGYLVTLDVTKVTSQPRPANVTLMLTLPHEYYESMDLLRPDDQVKFHSEDRHVLCATRQSFVPTNPIEFESDVEL